MDVCRGVCVRDFDLVLGYVVYSCRRHERARERSLGACVCEGEIRE